MANTDCRGRLYLISFHATTYVWPYHWLPDRLMGYHQVQEDTGFSISPFDLEVGFLLPEPPSIVHTVPASFRLTRQTATRFGI
jgi:hypothetical protein